MNKFSFVPLIQGTETTDYVHICLSLSNGELSTEAMDEPQLMHEHIKTFLSDQGKSIAYGGYLEERSLYNRSSHFQSQHHKRNIHLGIDFWCDENRGVCCPINGVVHSFKDNENFGDYGPTIILEHTYKKSRFYTLYGHLTRESLKDKNKGQQIKKGAVFARIGEAAVNGNYAPHLHFQVIKDLEGKQGDYPGVCSAEELSFYKKNCPDPLLFKALE